LGLNKSSNSNLEVAKIEKEWLAVFSWKTLA
jgi:hypothetical protein